MLLLSMLVLLFNYTATTEIYTYLPTLSLHAALPSSDSRLVPGTVSGGGGSDSGVDYFIAEKQVILPIDNRNATTNIGCAQTAAGTAARARSTTNAFTKIGRASCRERVCTYV